MSDRKERDPHKAVDYIIANAKKFAKAKAERVYLEEFRKSLKAILMKRSLEETIGAQEREAYANEEYKSLLEGLRDAIEIEESLRWDLIAAQARVEIWRSEQANLRVEGKVTL
jgi:hypothetical protein